MKLTDRLAAAVSLIPQGAVIADIGTDHAYIPVSVCESGLSVGHCRLTCIKAGEVDGAVICGMGGPLMVRILQTSYAVWQSLKFVVLQPQSDAGALRRYLYEHGWHIKDERLVIDDGRLYELMRAVPGQAGALPDWIYDIGPVNWQRRDPLLSRKVDILMETKGHILEGLKKSRKDVHERMEKIESELRFWRELKWQLQ